MQLLLERTPEYLEGTFWRPIEYAVYQKELVEEARRETGDTEADRTRSVRTTHKLSSVDLLLVGGREDYSEVKIEDAYQKGKFVDGFIYVKALGIFVHQDEVEYCEDRSESLSPGVVFGKGSRIDDDVSVGPYTEIESGVRIKAGSRIGQSCVVRKGSVIDKDSTLEARTYIGQFFRSKPGLRVGQDSVVHRRVAVGWGVKFGESNKISSEVRVADGAEFAALVTVNQGSTIGPDNVFNAGTTVGVDVHTGANVIVDGQIGSFTWLSDNVSIGPNAVVGTSNFIGRDAVIGESAIIGDNCHLAGRNVIGAESVFGDFVRVAKDVFLVSPTYAYTGQVIMKSNLFASPPSGERPDEQWDL